MSKSYLDDDWDPTTKWWARHPVWAGLIAVVAITVIGGLFSAAIWGVGVGTSDIRGRGEARKQINEANNRIAKQELFESYIADIKSYDRQIDTAAQAVAVAAADPSTDPAELGRLRQVVTGLKNICVSASNDYDAEARKQSSERFRSADLPVSITEDDPNLPGPWQDFDCQEAS